MKRNGPKVSQMKPLSKEQVSRLLKKSRAGNRRAFGRLVEAFQDKILYLAFDLVGSWEDAGDIAQEVFVKAFQRLSGFQERASFSSWLYRITVNQATDWHRRNQRRPADSLDALLDVGGESRISNLPQAFSTESGLERSEIRQTLEAAISHLSVNQRTAIVLRFFHELSTRDIAGIMNCTENTVRIHVFRGLERLRKLLPDLHQV